MLLEELKILIRSIIEEEKCSGKNPGLWCNIHKRRKKGLPRKKPGQEGYPKSLKIDEVDMIDSFDEAVTEKLDDTLEEKECKGTESAPVGSPRQKSFCKRMCGHKKHNTSKDTAEDPDSCIRQALRRWKCRCH
jgi:hypothetical protein